MTVIELKGLRFAAPYPPILFTGEKNKTFRVTGGERFNAGDFISLRYVDGEEFARAVVLEKYRKRFEELNERDWEGHERFASPEEMYRTYSNWQGFPVDPKTELDVIVYTNFRLTGKIRSNSV
jgi:hypothetical protein